MKFPESKLAHAYLDGLSGIEVGGSAHNPFGLNTKNVDITTENIFKQYEIDLAGEKLKVDIVAPGDNIPLPDESQDFVLTSHVLEHFPDPIKALKEWYRVIKKGGYLFLIIPHKERTFDKDRERTVLKDLIDVHDGKKSLTAVNEHFSVWITEDIVELINYLGWKIVFVQDVDDKVSNGFTIVVKKPLSNDCLSLDIDLKLKEKLFQKSNIVLKDKSSIKSLVKAVLESDEKLGALQEKNDVLNAELVSLRSTFDSEKILEEKMREEIRSMQNSKFWKLRGWYMRCKTFLIGKKK